MPGYLGSQLRREYKSRIVWAPKKKRPRNGFISGTRLRRVGSCSESVQNGPKMAHPAGPYMPLSAWPSVARQVHHHSRNPEHYVWATWVAWSGVRNWDPFLFLKMNIADIWAVCPKPKWCITPEPLTHVDDGFYRNPSLIFLLNR